jgi:ribosomal protein L10
MQVQAYVGYWENERFYPLEQPVRKAGKQKAILTFLDDSSSEPVPQSIQKSEIPSEFTSLAEKVGVIKAQERIDWLNRLEAAVEQSLDEEMVYIPRSKEMRQPLNFGD